MLEKLTSELTSISQGDTKKKILDRISTREKAEEWMEELKIGAKELWMFDTESHRAYQNKFAQIQIGINRFARDEERTKIAVELKERSKSVHAYLAEKSKALTDAEAARDLARSKLTNLEARHTALFSDLEIRKKKAGGDEQAAQEAFDLAILGGDESLQVSTAEILSAKKIVTAVVNSPTGPIALQINAFAREVVAAKEVLKDAERAVAEATALHLEATAAKAILEYDRAILPLYDVWQRAYSVIVDVRNSAKQLPNESDSYRRLYKFSPNFDNAPVLPVGSFKQNLGKFEYHSQKTIEFTLGPGSVDIGVLAEPLPKPRFEDVGDRKEAEDAYSRRLNKQEKPGDQELVNEYMTHMQAFQNEPFHSKLLTKVSA